MEQNPLTQSSVIPKQNQPLDQGPVPLNQPYRKDLKSTPVIEAIEHAGQTAVAKTVVTVPENLAKNESNARILDKIKDSETKTKRNKDAATNKQPEPKQQQEKTEKTMQSLTKAKDKIAKSPSTKMSKILKIAVGIGVAILCIGLLFILLGILFRTIIVGIGVFFIAAVVIWPKSNAI